MRQYIRISRLFVNSLNNASLIRANSAQNTLYRLNKTRQFFSLPSLEHLKSRVKNIISPREDLIDFPKIKGYEGKVNCHGRKHGFGKYTFENGDLFEGDFKDDMMDGYGEYCGHNGDIYRGYFKNNTFHGLGNLVLTNGNEFTGSFEDGKQNGFGELEYSNGDVYTGDFKDGMFHGIGTIKYLSTGKKVMGHFVNGNMIEEMK